MGSLRPGAAEAAQLPGPTAAEGARGLALQSLGLGETGRPQGPAGMRAPTPARLRRAALGRRRRPLRISLCVGPCAAASRPHPRPGKQAPGAGLGGKGPGRCAVASQGRRLGPGSPGPEEEPAPPPPPPAPPRSRGRARRRRRCCSRCRFSATHRRDTRAGQPRPPALCPPELRAAPPAARLCAPAAPHAPRCPLLGFPSRPRTALLVCRRRPGPP